MLTTAYLTQHLGTSGLDAADLAVLTLLEAGVVASFEGATGRVLPGEESADIVDILDGPGNETLELSMPVDADTDETGVTVEFVSGATTWSAFTGTPRPYRIDPNPRMDGIRNLLTISRGLKWPHGRRCIRVSYPSDPSAAGLAEVRAMVADLTCKRFVSRTRATLAGAEEQQPDGIPQQYQAIVERWKRPMTPYQPTLRHGG